MAGEDVCSFGVETALKDRPESASPAHLIQLLDDFKVVVFRGASLTREQHLFAAHRLGTPIAHPYLARKDGTDPNLLVMEGERALARVFHADETFLEAPPTTCLLRIDIVPQFGGETTWVDLEAAFQSLSTAEKRKIVGLIAVHETPDGDRRALHPLIRAHPRTHRPALFINRLYTTEIRGRGATHQLLNELLEVVEDPRFARAYRWQPGDFVIWDNCNTLHRVEDNFNTFRRVERVAVEERVPVGFEFA